MGRNSALPSLPPGRGGKDSETAPPAPKAYLTFGPFGCSGWLYRTFVVGHAGGTDFGRFGALLYWIDARFP